MELVIPGKIVQLHFPQLYRTNRTYNIGEHLVRGILLKLPISAFMRHIIGIVRQQQNIGAPIHVQAPYDLLVKVPSDFSVLQLRVPKIHQQPVLFTVHNLLGGKHNINQVFSQCTRHGLFQKSQILLDLFLRQHSKRLLQIGDQLAAAVNKAPVNTADSIFFRSPASAQFT